MENLKNIPVMVTGGASGMGAATAKLLSEKGAKVALLDMNLAAAEKVAQEINGLAITCNVADAESVTQTMQSINATYGAPRVCINCAGIAPAKRIVGREGAMPLDDFAKVITVNLIGTFNVMRIFAANLSTIEPLTSGERGVIINTASIAAFEGQIGQAAYSASKAGIVGLTLPAARDLAKFGIRVMTIAPGIMATPMMAAMPQEVQDSLAAMMPFPQRLGQASEFAKLALHIIENEYLNGETIRLDAAIRMREK